MTTLVDANILLYAKFLDYSQHERARSWLDQALSGPQPVGLPWVSINAFIRISTNSRIFQTPLRTEEAVEQVREWCSREVVWHPEPGRHFSTIYGDLLTKHHCVADLVPDAYLAAIALEHGLTVVSSDTDFVRFVDVKRLNPLD